MAALCTMRATIPKFKIRKDFNLKVQGRRGNSAPGLMRLQTGGCGNSTAGSLEEDESARGRVPRGFSVWTELVRGDSHPAGGHARPELGERVARCGE